MSRTTNQTRGRYTQPVPTSNLEDYEGDFPEFEPFEDEPGSEAAPRSYPPAGGLIVEHIDMCKEMNGPKHYTTSYDNPNLVVRRGLDFTIRLTLNRPLTEHDDFQLEFLIGSNPSANKGSLVVVPFGPREGGPWLGQILDVQGQVVVLSITPAPNCIVGKFRMYVAFAVGGGMERSKRDAATDVYVLFNAWCPEDTVFLPNEAERMEYVLNDVGVIFNGSVGAVASRNWVYGQFEKGVLDACIHLLDVCHMPIDDRGDVLKLVRMGSAVINSNDDNGVLEGNWSEDYSMGTSPTAWTGSVSILLQYVNSNSPVRYGQCWVFAGVFNTFLRCLGIPSRVISNFNSAHDNTGDLKTELIFKPDGSMDRRASRDSVWNFHSWNEVCTTRPDLPPGLGGWQVVDATPQETSDGNFRCGPASVAAIKEGLLCHPFDARFVFAEVNSDMICLKKDKYGILSPYRVDKTYIGQFICTQAVGSMTYVDVTHTYKHPEGSAADNSTMARAEEYGCERDHSRVVEAQVSADIRAEQCHLGDDVNLVVTFHNRGEDSRIVKAHLEGSVVFYTGVTASHFKNQDFTVEVPPQQKTSVTIKVAAQDYMPHLQSQLSLSFVLTGKSANQSLSAIKVVSLLTPPLSVMVSGYPRVQQQMFVTISFTNPFTFPLYNVYLFCEGAGLMSLKNHFYSVIGPNATVSWQEMFAPRLKGSRRITALLDCNELRQVQGHVDVVISD
ncbi:coagulation factor XIII A chain-like [Mugil cephalus]|uniref:coagulation factor XIII A chain-like n=1 Tax=Mugil cephalus TaxID=48193 RepID=UPI001FB5FF85|nr:coagulation factor XIII A chain-like [Mugil cephalus]